MSYVNSGNMRSVGKVPFPKSIRFKFTLIYSLITFFFSAMVVFSLNYSINNYFNENNAYGGGRKSLHMMNRPLLTEKERDFLQETRRVDVREIQKRSLQSLIPLALFSFIIGYVLSGNITKSLISMQQKIDKLTDQDLGLQLNIKGEDEIARLGQSFDKMSLRLKSSFDDQTRFIQDASHELKTPLAIMQANLEDLLDSKNIKDKETLEGINTAVTGVKRMNLLTEKLLDISNSRKLNLEKVNLIAIVNSQVKQLQKVARESNVKMEILEENEIYINADKIALSQMIFNLLDNAIKYSSKIRKSQVDINVITKAESIQLIISDNGIGIQKEKQKKIFDRFYQVDTSRNSKKNGSGLGLSIVKSIVEEHNWKISVKSSKKGTIFVITFT